MKRKTNKKYTMEALEKRFVKTDYSQPESRWQTAKTIDTDALNDNIIIYLQSMRDLYDAMIDPKRSINAVIWKAFAMVAETDINYIHYGETHTDMGVLHIEFYATSKQLRDFLNKYGMDYEALEPSVIYARKKRREMRRERERRAQDVTKC